ncbi:MAG: TonB-dependent receptor plug domain-containing protein [Tannerellaceae bacterium]|nr:TonB-dependent receptor plug domain-containing protein [Tannerellaceae bacterium]
MNISLIFGVPPVLTGGESLILVDNVPFAGSIELINPEDIETITILKDGGAAAIYGSRSAFGVILITTKSAELNQKI